jgi:uncharacterized protein
MNCPVCNVTLQLAERKNVEIDYCPQCRGIWLDRGKLDKIIEQSIPAAPSRPAQSGGLSDILGSSRDKYNDHHPDDHKHRDSHNDDYGHHKKRSIFDLFD